MIAKRLDLYMKNIFLFYIDLFHDRSVFHTEDATLISYPPQLYTLHRHTFHLPAYLLSRSSHDLRSPGPLTYTMPPVDMGSCCRRGMNGGCVGWLSRLGDVWVSSVVGGLWGLPLT